MGTPSHIDLILAQMRQGGTVVQGGSRCHVEWGYADADGFYAEHFDEGAVERRPAREADIRSLHAREPALFDGLLRRHGWRQVRAALDADDRPAAVAALEWMIARCDQPGNAAVWLAALGPEPPSEALADAIRARSRSKVLWHAIMDGLEWRRDAATAARAAWLLDALVDRVKGIEGQARLRARFAALA